MKTAEEVLNDYGCPEIPFDENVTMYYPAIINAMHEYANQFKPQPSISDEEIEKEARWRFTDGHGAEDDFGITVFTEACNWLRDRLTTQKDNNGWVSVDIIFLEKERLEWSLKVFTDATAISSLRKLEEEIKEIEKNINNNIKDPVEYADALMCLFDSAGRTGILPTEIFKSFSEKLKINKSRDWSKNNDNTYSHVKISPPSNK